MPISLSALVLNQSYEPLCIVSVKRAAVLLLSKKAETVEHGDGYLRSTTTHIRTPAVVRLNRYIRIPRQVSSNPNRRGVFIRDNNACVYCGGKAETIDHVVPRSRGGTHTWDNVVAACANCNHRKSDRSLADLGWTLNRTPTVPSSWQLRGLSIHRHTDPRWEVWLPGSSRQVMAA
ncbi:HNH endonuclease [Natronoglycomyces albus]|uniref:HNH endonuclease n=1 Tax=Natronoglycomyces albus TaxID=2811108 RepID=A0A895XWS8_9ACTN|nr:HNH endonuclease [Natronoglycomyces albus]